MGVCGNVCCVAAVVKNSGVFFAVTPAVSAHKSKNAYVGVFEEMMCVVCVIVTKGAIVVNRRELGATSEAGKCLFRAVLASCGQMPRDNRCTYMAHVCFYVCCSDCVGVCWNVCCVVDVIKDSVF